MSRRTIVIGLGAWGTIGALLAAVASPVCAQTYTQSTFTQGMTNLSSPTVLWSANGQDEVVSGSIAIGFTFNFYGNAYTTCIISPNGYIRFGSSTDTYANTAIPSATDPDNFAAPWWDDLIVATAQGTADAVNYKTEGAAPNRVFTVEWYSVSKYSGGTAEYYYFQVKLYEGTDVVEFHYSATWNSADSESASIGIENSDGSAGFDATGLGTANASRPSVNYRFTPVPGYWVGGYSTDPTNWDDARNWFGAIPTSTTDVTIRGSLSSYATLTSGTPSCQALTIDSGGSLSWSGATAPYLSVNGNIANNGTLTGNSQTTWDIYLNVAANVGGTGTWTDIDFDIRPGGSVVLTANVAWRYTLLRNSLTIGAYTLTCNGNFDVLSGCQVVMTNSLGIIDVNGPVYWEDGSSENITAGTIRCSGDWYFYSNATQTITLTGTNVVEFDGTGTQTIYVLDTGCFFDSVVFKNTGSARTVYLDTTSTDYLWVGDDLTIEANCTFDFEGTVAASNRLEVDDNLNVYGSITMDDADDLLLLTDTYWYSGSAETISLGTIKIQGQAYFYSGSNFTPTGGTVIWDMNESTVDNDL